MTKRVKIAPGYSRVQLPNDFAYDAGDEVNLTDEEFAQIDPDLLEVIVLDISTSPTADLEARVAALEAAPSGTTGAGDHLNVESDYNDTHVLVANAVATIPGVDLSYAAPYVSVGDSLEVVERASEFVPEMIHIVEGTVFGGAITVDVATGVLADASLVLQLCFCADPAMAVGFPQAYSLAPVFIISGAAPYMLVPLPVFVPPAGKPYVYVTARARGADVPIDAIGFDLVRIA